MGPPFGHHGRPPRGARCLAFRGQFLERVSVIIGTDSLAGGSCSGGIGLGVCSRSSGRHPPFRAERKRTNPLTYCLALRLDEGMVFLADTRTNAGVDDVGTYRKMHVLQPAPDRLFVVESAGSLATTQEVLDRIGARPGRGRRGREPGHGRPSLRGGAVPGSPEPSGRARAQDGPERDRRGRHGDLHPRAATSGRSHPTSCSSTPRAITSGPPTSARSSRSERASTGSSCSSWPSRPTSTS